jgi:drug/metabolite transporter (DMT)-like permease
MRTTDWLLLVLLSVLWGATFFFVAVALQDLPPLTLVLARVALAALILVSIGRVLGLAWPGDLAAWRAWRSSTTSSRSVSYSMARPASPAPWHRC